MRSRRGQHDPSDRVAWSDDPVFQWPGLRILEAGDGKAKLAMRAQKHHFGNGIDPTAINGAIIAYMFDCLLGAAVASTWTDEDMAGQVTVNLNMSYLRPLRVSTVIGTAAVTQRGAQLAFAKGEIVDDDGEVCAKCDGIYRLFPGRRSSARETT